MWGQAGCPIISRFAHPLPAYNQSWASPRIGRMVCFVNVKSVDRIIYSIFQRFSLEWKTRTLNLFTLTT